MVQIGLKTEFAPFQNEHASYAFDSIVFSILNRIKCKSMSCHGHLRSNLTSGGQNNTKKSFFLNSNMDMYVMHLIR